VLERIRAFGGVLLLLGVVFAPAVMAGVPKVAVIEDYGATW
jgi:hypothetical protein